MKKYTIDIEQLKYVKCVNAETSYSLAYYDYQLHAEFNLKFSNSNAQPENAEKLKKNDIILLFQHEKDKKEKIIGDWRLTHLVTPVNDNDVKNEKSSNKYPYYIVVKVVGKIPDGFDIKNNTGLKKLLCGLTDCCRGGNVCLFKEAIMPFANILKVKKKILKIFKKHGYLV